MKTIGKKVCLLGDFTVGKTSLVRRFVYDLFDDKHHSGVGVKVSRKTVAIPRADGVVVDLTMMLWDLAGSEDFEQMQGSFLRGASGAVLVCDLTRPESLLRLEQYMAALRRFAPESVTILAANKSDCQESLLLADQVAQAAAMCGATYFITSARTGENVEEMFRRLGQMLGTV